MKFRTKLLFVMRLTTLFILAASLHVSAGTYSQTVSYTAKNAGLSTILSAIEKQTGYVFIYNDKDIALAKPVTVELKGASVEKTLQEVFKDQPLSWQIKGAKTVVISVKVQPALIASELTPPPVVRGRVTNEKGEPVAGVSISLKGGKVIGVTNDNGEFVLNNVADDAVLVFSAVSIETFEVKVGGRSELAFTAKTKVSQLEDVVINKGYYSTSQKLNTGNVVKISSEDIRKQPISNPIQALQARVPGLFIAQASGVAGRAETFRLRGQNSIANGNNPLFIVDGVPYNSGSLSFNGGGGGSLSPFNDLNPNDIESIEVLKDADATAIYGSRGANGVVLITTKKAKAGETKIDFNIYGGGGKITRRMNLMNTQQYLQMRREAFANDGRNPVATTPAISPNVYAPDLMLWDTTRYTDWQELLIGGSSNVVDAQGSISGGSSNTSFILSGNYRRETTVFPGNYADRKISTHFNFHHQLPNNRFSVGLSLNYVNGKNLLPQSDLSGLVQLAPTAPKLYDASGNLNWENSTWSNPFALIHRTSTSITNNLISNLVLRYSVIKGLDIKLSSNYLIYRLNETLLTPGSSFNPAQLVTTQRRNATTNAEQSTWNIEPQLTYTKAFGKSEINLLAGATFLQSVQKQFSLTATGFSSDDLIENLANASTVLTPIYNYSNYKYNAFFGRINYNLDRKYLLNLTLRRDGSTRYSADSRFGNFGAIGAGWIFSEENLIKHNLAFLSYGKLRGSYGVTGNDQIGDYNYMVTYSTYPSAYQGLTGLQPNGLPNPEYAWERINKLELGLELGFLKDRLMANASYYRNRTGNQVVRKPLPNFTGGSSILANLPAVVENSGLELELRSVNIESKDFIWKTSFNISFPKNKLVSFPDLQNTTYATRFEVGKSLFIQKLFHFTGVNPATGLYTFEDVDKNGTITTPNDYTSFKENAQVFYGGLNNSFRFKGFQLDFTFQFVKQIAENYTKNFNMPGGVVGSQYNQLTLVMERWRQPGDNTALQKYSQDFGSAVATNYFSYLSSSDAIFSDASFIRLKNLFVSYSLPEKWQKRMGIQLARIYLQGQNLITFTNYLGMDPETRSQLPPIRMITAGLQLTF